MCRLSLAQLERERSPVLDLDSMVADSIAEENIEDFESPEAVPQRSEPRARAHSIGSKRGSFEDSTPSSEASTRRSRGVTNATRISDSSRIRRSNENTSSDDARKSSEKSTIKSGRGGRGNKTRTSRSPGSVTPVVNTSQETVDYITPRKSATRGRVLTPARCMVGSLTPTTGGRLGDDSDLSTRGSTLGTVRSDSVRRSLNQQMASFSDEDSVENQNTRQAKHSTSHQGDSMDDFLPEGDVRKPATKAKRANVKRPRKKARLDPVVFEDTKSPSIEDSSVSLWLLLGFYFNSNIFGP